MTLADLTPRAIRTIAAVREDLLKLSGPDRLNPGVTQVLTHLSIATETLRRLASPEPEEG